MSQISLRVGNAGTAWRRRAIGTSPTIAIVAAWRKSDTSGNAGGSYYGRNAPGTSRLVIDRARGVVIGATITGAEIADFLHAATIAIVGEVPVARLRHAVPAFPTRSEIWLNLLEKAETGR